MIAFCFRVFFDILVRGSQQDERAKMLAIEANNVCDCILTMKPYLLIHGLHYKHLRMNLPRLNPALLMMVLCFCDI